MVDGSDGEWDVRAESDAAGGDWDGCDEVGDGVGEGRAVEGEDAGGWVVGDGARAHEVGAGGGAGQGAVVEGPGVVFVGVDEDEHVVVGALWESDCDAGGQCRDQLIRHGISTESNR